MLRGHSQGVAPTRQAPLHARHNCFSRGDAPSWRVSTLIRQQWHRQQRGGRACVMAANQDNMPPIMVNACSGKVSILY